MRKIIRIAIKFLVSIAGLVILILLFINLPFSRNFVTGRVNALFQKLELPLNIQTIKAVRLKKVHVEGFSIVDPRGDTIIYAGNVKSHIKLLALLKSKVVLDETELSGVGVELLMNYQTRNYTIGESFKKGKNKKPADPEKKGSKWEIKIRKGEIRTVHFFMEDTLSGIHIKQDVDELKLRRFKLGLLEREIGAHTIDFKGAVGSVKVSPRQVEKRERKNRAREPWNFGLGNLAMEEVDFAFEQTGDSLLLEVLMDKGMFETKKMDITGRVLDLEKIVVEGTTGKLYTTQKSGSRPDSKNSKPSGFPWDIKTSKLHLEGVDVVFGNYAFQSGGSLSQGIGMEDLEMKLRDFQISQTHVGMKLSSLGFQLNNGFTLDQMEANLKSDAESTSIKMEVETGRSRLDLAAEARLGFFDLLRDPSGAADAHLQIKDALLHLSDISSFTTVLENNPVYPVLAATPTRIDAQVEIEESKLIVSEFSLSQKQNFKLSLNGYANTPFEPSNTSGQMDLTLSEINMPWLKELIPNTGIDSLLSDTTELSLIASISDTFCTPEIVMQLASNVGLIDLTGHLNFENRSYAISSHFGEILLGSLLKVPTLGSLNGSVAVEGAGTSAETLYSKIKLQIDSITYNGYTYTRTNIKGVLRPGVYDFNLQAHDSAFNSDLSVNLLQTDSLFTANASGTLFARLDRLNLFTDTLTVETDIEATLIKKPDVFETGLSLQEIELISPVESAKLQKMEAFFRTDTSRTHLSGEGDFFNLDIQVDKSIHDLDRFAADYANYLRTFVDSSRTTFEQRVTQLPGIYATSSITNHNALDILLQDTALHISSLNFTILNEPVHKKIKYNIEGSGLRYKMARLGDLDLDVVDSAGVLDLHVIADSSSIFSGHPSTYQVSSQFASWRGLTELFIFNQQSDTLYNIEVESVIDENQMILNIPSQQLVLNHQKWDLDSSAFLSIELDSFRLSPDFTMRTDSSVLQLTHRDLEEGIDYHLNANRVKLSSLIWDDLLSTKPDGYLSGSIDLSLDQQGEKEIMTNLNVEDMSLSGLEFNQLLIDGFLAISDSGNYSTKLFAQLDSSTLEVEGENILGENRYLRADYSHIPLEIVESFTEKYLSEMAGYISGSFEESTLSKSEKFTGDLSFRGAKLKIVPLNTPFTIPDQRIQFEGDKIILSDFRILDTLNKALEVDGFIDFQDRPVFTDLTISSSMLQLMNTTEEDNENFYGSLFVDSDISFKGAINNPNIDAKISLSRGTELTINSKDDVDLSESAELVHFTSHTETSEPVQLPAMVGPRKFHMASIETIIEIDPATRVNFNLAKKIFHINLAIKGGGLLNYSMLNNNQVSLAGRYEISEGSAELNIVGWPNKYFEISKGGFVNWDGKVEDPELKFEAISKVSSSYTNPVDGRMRNVDFNVVLMLSQHLSDLDILFTINTEDQYLMSIINTLSPEEQMRQAITILLFEIIDLPGISTSSDYMSQQVSQILASQLNQITKSAIKGVDISFGIDTYTQSVQGGGENTSTSLSYEVKKSLLNDRAEIQVSGRIQNPNDVPGASDQTLNNLSFEYQLDSAETKYLKVYNEQTYEDVFEGQVIKTGVGFTYRKPYRTFGDIWKRKKKRQNSHE